MMELKFRAWIKDYIKESSIPKSMRANYGFPKMVTPLCVYSENGFEYQEGLGYRKISKKDYDFVLMQFTGLKDCEGREIYEGDILERDIGGDHNYVVEFGEGMFYADRAVSFPEKPYHYEIIGNVYENPELLKE